MVCLEITCFERRRRRRVCGSLCVWKVYVLCHYMGALGVTPSSVVKSSFARVVLPAKRLSTLPDKHIFARTSKVRSRQSDDDKVFAGERECDVVRTMPPNPDRTLILFFGLGVVLWWLENAINEGCTTNEPRKRKQLTNKHPIEGTM